MAKACLLSLKLIKFSEGKANAFCLSKEITFTLELFVRSVLIVESDFTKKKNIQEAARK